MPKYTCKYCGDKFTVSKEEQDEINSGFSDDPQICDECFKLRDNASALYSFDDFSDADTGL